MLGSNRWGFFPGVSAGWVFGKENFVADNLHWLSFGKLRASYGLNGNASGIGAYDLQGSYANTAIYNGNNGFRIAQLSNPGLRWERTRTAEAGVDLGFLQNRLNVNLTYYNRLTLDKYANFTLPSTAGDAKWRDINGDGVIDSRDQVKVGNSTPRWFGGFNTVLNWKGFQLYARFDYALGFWTMDVASPWYNGCGQGTYNATTDVFDTWTPDNTGAKYPKYVYADQLGKANYFRNSTLFSYRGDYLAFREVSLSWSLPKTLLNRIRLQNITLSVTGQNLGYLTAAPTNTPEVARVGYGASGDGYGLPRTVLFGLDITF